MAYQDWWATVKYSSRYGCKNTDEVSVSKIQVEFISKKGKIKRKEFKPDNLNDFDPAAWYVVWSEKGVREGGEFPFYALLGRLSETKEGLLADGLARTKWPTVDEKEDEPDTCVSGDDNSKTLHSAVVIHKESRKKGKASKRMAQQDALESHMNNTSLDNEEHVEQHREPDSEETVSALKAKIKRLEQEREFSVVKEFVKKELESLHDVLRVLVASVSTLKDETNVLKVDLQSQSGELTLVQSSLSHLRTLLGVSPRKAIRQEWLDSLPDV